MIDARGSISLGVGCGPRSPEKTSAHATAQQSSATENIYFHINASQPITGLVQLPDKVVARFALTTYPYLLGVMLPFECHCRELVGRLCATQPLN